MIRIRLSKDRGHADHGWLKSAHSFSFADYHDPEHMAFGPLRVLNQDRVAPGEGFPTHGHANMEIVSYVLSGALEHRDSMGTGSVIGPGDVQIMSAGSGIRHSEFNASKSEPVHFLQMWVIPAETGTEPRYGQEAFSEPEREGQLRLVVSPDGRDGSTSIGQDARLYVGLFAQGDQAAHSFGAGRGGWLHVAEGSLELNGVRLFAGDGAAIQDEPSIHISGAESAHAVLWDLPVGEQALPTGAYGARS